MSRPSYLLVPWTISGKNSNPISLDGNLFVGFVVPSTIASSAMTFSMATTKNITNSIVWNPVNNSSGALSIAISASTSGYYGLTNDQQRTFDGVEIFRMQGSSNEVINQTIYAVLLPRPSI